MSARPDRADDADRYRDAGPLDPDSSARSDATSASVTSDRMVSPAHDNARPEHAEGFARWLDDE
jgi:hypothetical protein